MTTQQLMELAKHGFYTPYCYTCRDSDGVCRGAEVVTCPDCKGYMKRLRAEKALQDQLLRARWMTFDEQVSSAEDNVRELNTLTAEAEEVTDHSFRWSVSDRTVFPV